MWSLRVVSDDANITGIHRRSRVGFSFDCKCHQDGQRKLGRHGNRAQHYPITGCSWKRLRSLGGLKDTDFQPARVKSSGRGFSGVGILAKGPPSGESKWLLLGSVGLWQFFLPTVNNPDRSCEHCSIPEPPLKRGTVRRMRAGRQNWHVWSSKPESLAPLILC